MSDFHDVEYLTLVNRVLTTGVQKGDRTIISQ